MGPLKFISAGRKGSAGETQPPLQGYSRVARSAVRRHCQSTLGLLIFASVRRVGGRFPGERHVPEAVGFNASITASSPFTSWFRAPEGTSWAPSPKKRGQALEGRRIICDQTVQGWAEAWLRAKGKDPGNRSAGDMGAGRRLPDRPGAVRVG